MNITRLYEILAETTAQFRKGEVYEGTPELVEQAKALDAGERDEPLEGGGVLHVYAMPNVADARHDLDLVDVHFVQIGVDREKAALRRDELVGILNTYPEPDRLAGGPSYIEVGGVIGDQGAAFQLFALGKVLGLWDIITPATMGFTGADADRMAGSGFVMMSGYRQAVAA